MDIIGKNNVDDEVEDYIISLEPVTRKKTLIAPRTLYNFIVQILRTTSMLLDAIRKVIDKLSLVLNFKNKT